MSGQSFPVGRITLSVRAAAGISEDLSGPEIELVLPGFGEIMRVRLFEKMPAAILWRAVAGVAVEPDRPAVIGECLALIAPALPNVSITSRAGVRARPRLQEHHENTRLSRSSRCYGAFG